jgi:hypothetical protein
MNHRSTIKALRKELKWYKIALIHTIAEEGGRDPKEVKSELEEEYSEFDT